MREDREYNPKVALEKDIKTYLTQIDTSNSNLIFNKLEEAVEEVEDGDNDVYYFLSLFGGLNGRGQFLFYMEDVEKLIKKLMIRCDDVWLVEWTNDCCDDSFDITIGLRI